VPTGLLPALVAALAVVGQAAPAPVPRPTPGPSRPAPAGRPAGRTPPPAPAYFTSPFALEEMRGKQAVVETSAGTFVIQLLPDAAPNHAALFMKLARDGSYAGTVFHRVIRYGMIQGGDPLSRDPTRAAEYGTGGHNQVRAESRAEKTTAGAVAAALLPGRPDSGGQQFFVLASDQPAIDGQYTVFGRVVEGLEVVQAISAVDADASGAPRSRVAIGAVTIRDTPVDPYLHAAAADLSGYLARIETTLGTIDLEMLPDKAIETVRAFLQWADAGIYDGIKIHRVAKDFVIQTGALAFRDVPLTASQQQLIRNLPPEFTDTPNVPGIVSIARGTDPGSGSTSFFLCIGSCRAIDGQYTVFARVAGGQPVVDAIAAVAVEGEAPVVPIVVTRIRGLKR
jgi:cyclophilin family peptidyl-prolyl cis-trans isomerase